jgi:ABC-type glycerol-3-phosphate transport system permease component
VRQRERPELIPIPILVVLVFLGRWFVAGMTVGALKG